MKCPISQTAPPGRAADIDLYLQKETDEDGWKDVAAAETGDTTQEALSAGERGEGTGGSGSVSTAQIVAGESYGLIQP